MSAATPCATDLPAEVRSGVEETPWIWTGLLLGTIVVVDALIATSDDVSSSLRLLSLAIGLAMGVLGVVAVRHQPLMDDRDLPAILYCSALIVGTAATMLITPAGFTLLFGVYPQLFAVPRRRSAQVALAVAMSVVAGVISAGQNGWTATAIWVSVAVFGGSAVFASAMGLWISQVMDKSARRAELIGELQRTRDALAAANREAGVQAERERMSAEIHDTLAQGFTSIVTLLQAAEVALPADAEEARRLVGLAQRSARTNLAEARALIAELAPPDLQASSLAESIRRVVQVAAAEAGLQATFESTGTSTRSPGDDVVLLRAAQEAIANVKRHAGASRVDVRLDLDGPARLTVVDDGQGFDPTSVAGFGLAGMRHRLEQVGGTVEVASAPGAGTRIEVSVP